MIAAAQRGSEESVQEIVLHHISFVSFRFDPLEVKAVRRKLHISQVQFSQLIGVSAATLRNWEQGRTYPEGAARALLRVAAKRPDIVLAALRS